MAGKKISHQDITGQQGINLVEDIALRMGYIWRPTSHMDAGVDGTIEIRDPTTGEMTNADVKVQVKATKNPFQAETADSFEYTCEARDIDYWLQGNAPVILVVCRPDTNEAYWVSIKDRFKDLAIRKTRKLKFDIRRDRFDETCASALANLAVPKDVGVYFAPPPVEERLYSNLLKVAEFAPQLYIAETEHRLPKEIWDKFRIMEVRPGPEWMLKNKQLMSFHDLGEYPWSHVCDAGTREVFATTEWALSDDVEKRRDFTRLLNQCLREKTRRLYLYYDRNQEHYYFGATSQRKPRRIEYQAVHKQVGRVVFKGYQSKKGPVRTAYYRHSAFKGHFLQFGNAWYLEITPTYRFTWNGRDLDKYHQERLQGIKRLERNPAVFGQLLMWANYLTRPNDLFTAEYPFLEFSELLTFDLAFGINDDAWLQVEDDDETEALRDVENQITLFGL